MFAFSRTAPKLAFAARSLKCSSRFYHDLVIDHYEHPRNVGMSHSLATIPYRLF